MPIKITERNLIKGKKRILNKIQEVTVNWQQQ